MAKKIFINLPVKDLDKTKEFFIKLGYKFNPQFTDERGGCLVISDDIYAMLLTEPFFKTFTKKQIADTGSTTEALVALSTEDRNDVDKMMEKVLKAGGRETGEMQNMDNMYGRSFEDLDGHTWELIWMDPSNIKK